MVRKRLSAWTTAILNSELRAGFLTIIVALLINELAFGGTESGAIATAAITVGAVLGAGASFVVSRFIRR